MKIFVLGTAVLSTLVAGAAHAQQPPIQINHAAPTPGICVYNGAQVLSRSLAGQALAARMRQLVQEVVGELQPYETTIQTEGQALAQLEQSGQQLDAARVQQFNQRRQEFSQLQRTRQAEIRYTELAQTSLIGDQARPLIAAAYQARSCSVLLDGESVLVSNPQMDITETVLQELNRNMSTINFNRMPVPPELQQQQQQ